MLGFVVLLVALSGPISYAQPARAAFRVARAAVVYDGAPSYQPSVVRTGDGSLLVSFMSKDNIYTTRSLDNGLTWQKPDEVVQGAATELGITKLRDGTILWPFFDEMVKMPCCEIRHFDTYVYRSTDNGRTWQGGAPIDTHIREPIPYGHIVELPDGKLLMPIWGAFRLGQRWRVGVLESTDEGRNWGNYRQIAYDPRAGCRPGNGFNETSIAELPNHTLVAILREQRVGTRDHEPDAGPCDHYTEPLRVHFYRSVSKDLGKTWSTPQRLELIGTSPSLRVLKNGALLLGYRNQPQHGADTQHYGVAVRISTDERKTWGEETDLRDPKGYQYTEKSFAGYPDFAGLPGGEILVVFHSIQVVNGKRQGYIALNVLRHFTAAKLR